MLLTDTPVLSPADVEAAALDQLFLVPASFTATFDRRGFALQRAEGWECSVDEVRVPLPAGIALTDDEARFDGVPGLHYVPAGPEGLEVRLTFLRLEEAGRAAVYAAGVA